MRLPMIWPIFWFLGAFAVMTALLADRGPLAVKRMPTGLKSTMISAGPSAVSAMKVWQKGTILPQVIIPVIFVLILSVAWCIGSYNRFIKYRNKIEEAWSGIDVALKRRFNLIPNLVRAIEGYGEHETKIISPWIWQPSGNYRRWVFHN